MERKMKDSGIPWIGHIPEEWNVSKIGQLYSNRYEKVSDKDYAPLSVTMQGILPQLETAAKTDDGDNRKLVRKGDFAINSRSDRRGSCGISPQDGSVSLINLILVPRHAMNPDYYNWLFHTPLFADEFYSWGHGIVADLWTTRWQEMKNIAIPVPHVEEQEKIAAYLDEKCGEIDELIGIEEQMISDLEAYRKAFITEAVTKGLKEAVPLIQVKTDWIKEMPKGWQYTRAKFFIDIKSGDGLNKEDIKDEEEYPVYGGGELIGFHQKYNVPENTIIIGRVGARCGCVRLTEKNSWATDNALVINTTQLPNFFLYLLEGANLNRLNESNAQPLITATKIKELKIPLPPLSEQQEIAEFLDAKCAEIDDLIKIKQEKIETLKEYRQSLIFEAVTGKIEIA